MINKEEMLPFILQVRAKEELSKGALLSSPACGELVRVNSDEFKKAPSQSMVHEAMLKHAELEYVVLIFMIGGCA